ncbi:MAG: hypothetical protein RR342_01325 [Bacilli bacterium]|jgi:hypothetical protein
MLNRSKFGDGKIYERNDCQRIKDVCAKHSENITLYEAQEIWQDVSDSYCAGWLFLPETDKELWSMINQYFTEDGDDEDDI